MNKDNLFGLDLNERKLIISLIQKELRSSKILRVWIFGSRARGDYQKYSDVDLLLESDPSSPLTAEQFVNIQSNLEESYLQYKVDLVLFEKLEKSYRENIDREKILFAAVAIE